MEKSQFEKNVQERLDVIYKKWSDNKDQPMKEFLETIKPWSALLVVVSRCHLLITNEGLDVFLGEDGYREVHPKLSDYLLLMNKVSGFDFILDIRRVIDQSVEAYYTRPEDQKSDEYILYEDKLENLFQELFDTLYGVEGTEAKFFEALWLTYKHLEDKDTIK